MQTFSAMIRRSTINSLAGTETIGGLTTNASNMNTTAYKAIRFENVLKENGQIELVKRTDMSQGSLVPTERELDIGLSEPGFIVVTNKNGQPAYTRDGSFQVNSEGMLVTANGSIVGNGIKIPTDYQRLLIKQDGRINVIQKLGEGEKTIGKLPIVNFANPEALKKIDDNQFAATVDSGEAKMLVDYRGVKQGKLEMSNLDIYETVGQVMSTNAQVTISSKMIKFMDDVYKQSISLRQ